MAPRDDPSTIPWSWSPSRALALAAVFLAWNPVFLGTLYARQQAFPFRWGTLALLLAATLLATVAAMSARSNRVLAGGAFTLSILFAAAIVPSTGAAILGLSLAALGLAAIYVTPLPRDLAGLGELAVFLVAGPLLVSAGYYAQSSELSSGALLASLPLGLLAAAVAFTEHFSHAPGEQDPMCPRFVAGESQASLLLWALPALAFLSIAMNVRLLEYPGPSLGALLAAAPYAWKVRSVRAGAPPGEARAATIFLLAVDVAAGLLVVAGFLLTSPPEP